MSRAIQTKDRGIQILRLLKQHGPLSFRALKHMIEPQIKERKLHNCIARLVKNGLILRRQERVFRGTGVFYQLTQDIQSREKIAIILKCRADDLSQAFFRSRELLHTEACAFLVHRLRKLFPDAQLTRDFEFYNSASANEILLTERSDYELQPDVLMSFGGGAGQARVSVAFEIERSRKSERRLAAKLHKYANETALDGVVYICDSEQISKPVQQVFKTKINPKSLRIRHYGEYFLLSSNEPSELFSGETKMFNSSVTPVMFVTWITQLRSTALTRRRNQTFEEGAVSCPLWENHSQAPTV